MTTLQEERLSVRPAESSDHPHSALRALGLGSLVDRIVASPAKRLHYEVDTYFREALVDWSRLAVSQAAKRLEPLASVVFKPDALAARCIEAAVQWLAANGFRPVAFAVFRYDRLLIREAWRFQFNIASNDRIEVVDELLTAAPSLYVLFASTPSELPAAARLAALKGPAQAARRRPEHLRFHLGAKCTLLNLIHTADDAADVLRELGIYFDAATRRELMRTALQGADVSAALTDQIARVYAECPAHDLGLAIAVRSIEAVCAQAAKSPALTLARALLREIGARTSRDWRALFTALDRAGARVAPWDRLVIATESIDCDVPGVSPLLD